MAFELFGVGGCCGIKTFVMEDHLVLQICRVKLQDALDSNDRDVMVSALKYAGKMLPFSVYYSGMSEARVIFYSYRCAPERVRFDKMEFLSIRWYVLGFINAIDREFTYVQYSSCQCTVAASVLFDRDEVFSSEDVLYVNGTAVLRVEDLLRVCGYAVKVGVSVKPGSKLFDEAVAAVSVFKGLERVLVNKESFGPVPKMLHLANDFLQLAVKPSLLKPGHKFIAAGLSRMVDLAIEFFALK